MAKCEPKSELKVRPIAPVAVGAAVPDTQRIVRDHLGDGIGGAGADRFQLLGREAVMF
jgi:hypothetical protein